VIRREFQRAVSTAHVLSLSIPRRFLRGNTSALLLTAVALACGVSLVCAIDLTNRCVQQAFVEVIDTMAGRASLHVSAGPAGLIPEDLVPPIATVAGVEMAVPIVTASAFLADGSGQQLAVHGIDIANEDDVRVYEPAGPGDGPIEDPLLFLSQPDSVILTEHFAAKHGLRVGDGIELLTPTGKRRFTVRALLAPRGIARVHGGNLMVMDIEAAEQVFTRPGFVSGVDIVVRRGVEVASVRDALTASLPPGLHVDSPAQRRLDLEKAMRAMQTMLTGVSLLGLVAPFLIVFGRLTTLFEVRTAQLAVMRAVGVREGRVRWELIKEALVLGTAGVAIGIPMGIGLGHLLLPAISTATALGAKLMAPDSVLTVRPVSLVLAAALGFGAALLAAALPAWRAAGVPVAETLRHHGVEQSAPGGVGPWLLRACVVLSTAALVAAHLITADVVTGLLASVLILVCGAVAARPLLGATAGILGRVVPRLAGPTGRLAVATLIQNPRRTAVAIATLGVGFGTVLWLATVARSFEGSVLEVMPAKMRGDLSVGSTNIDTGSVEAAVDGLLIPALSHIAGVDAVIGERAADWHYAGGPIAIDAFDPSYFTDVRFGAPTLIGRQLPGALAAVARGEAVVVSENFVQNLRVGVGDLLTLDTPSGALTLRVAAVWRDFLSPRGTVNMSRDVFRLWWHDEQVVRGLVKTAPGFSVGEVRATIQQSLGERYSLRVMTIRAFVDWLAGQVRRAFSGVYILAGLVLVVVVVGVGDTLAAGMVERRREFGLTRAIGVRRRVLERAVILEALLLGLFGLALAWTVGLALGALWVHSTFPALLGWTLTFHLPVRWFVTVAVGVLSTCLVAAYLPARRAARLDPIVALRTD
jgi:putative ABC transport system permease protein